MTNAPEGGEGSSAIAALATHVNRLAQELKSLAAKVDMLTRAQQEHAVTLNGISELRRQVEQILAVLGEEADDSPAAWFWLTMTDEERDEKFAELSDWSKPCSAPSTPTTSPTRSGPAGRTTPRPDGNWPRFTSNGPSPTSPVGPHPETPPTGTTAGPPA